MQGNAIFYFLLPVLHAIGAIISAILSFTCDTGKAKQTALIPYLLEDAVTGIPRINGFYAAFPWDEAGVFVTHEWNPFALVFVFEWLTAAFALRPLRYWMDRTRLLYIWILWLGAGLLVFISWTATNSGGAHVAMLCTVLASFVVCGAIGYSGLFSDVVDYEYTAIPEDPMPPVQPETKNDAPNKTKTQMFSDLQGRVWHIPSRSNQLKSTTTPVKKTAPGIPPVKIWDPPTQAYEYTMGVILRYLEYCVTAPLLFLAVVSLMVVDAPAWLFLTGYWLILLCNVFGVVLHASFSSSFLARQKNDTGLFSRIARIAPWDDHAVNEACLLQAAWISLLIPLTGLIYLTWDVLTSDDMPILVTLLIWNLLLSYSMFGIVPTFVYITGMGRKQLPWLLDLLNLAAKFPLPLIILSGFITRPGTTRFCYT